MYEARFKKYQIFVLLNYVMIFIDALPKYEWGMVDLSGYSYDPMEKYLGIVQN